MTSRVHRRQQSAQLTWRCPDPELFELIDAIVETVDTARDLDRLRSALEPLGARAVFDAELRFNGLSSSGLCLVCEDILSSDRRAGGVASS